MTQSLDPHKQRPRIVQHKTSLFSSLLFSCCVCLSGLHFTSLHGHKPHHTTTKNPTERQTPNAKHQTPNTKRQKIFFSSSSVDFFLAQHPIQSNPIQSNPNPGTSTAWRRGCVFVRDQHVQRQCVGRRGNGANLHTAARVAASGLCFVLGHHPHQCPAECLCPRRHRRRHFLCRAAAPQLDNHQDGVDQQLLPRVVVKVKEGCCCNTNTVSSIPTNFSRRDQCHRQATTIPPTLQMQCR